jgi:MHS family alpha-ketoglutarate permease-like MFS transporter
MQKYLVNTAGFAVTTASNLMAVVLLLYMAMQPLFGAISDRFGRRNLLFVFCGLGILCTVPLLGAIGTATSPATAGLLILAALAIVSCYTSISGVLKAELFPARIRALGVGLSYAIANALFGGSAEYVALRFKAAGNEGGFAWYVVAMMVVALIAVSFMPDMQKHGHMREEPVPAS